MIQAAQQAGTVRRILRAEDATPRECIAMMVLGAAAHGLALGAASGELRMAIYAAIKVPLLLCISSAVTIPNFYVLHAVLGLRDDFPRACTNLFAAQAALALTLAATAPLFVFLALNTSDGYVLTVADGILFLLAVTGAQIVLRRRYQPLIARDPRHRITLRSWTFLYAFFAIQLAWVLRPFLGTPGFAVEFLRDSALEQNAYVVLVDHIVQLFVR